MVVIQSILFTYNDKFYLEKRLAKELKDVNFVHSIEGNLKN